MCYVLLGKTIYKRSGNRIMKKRIIALLLVFVLAALCACSKSTEPTSKKEDVTQAPKEDNGGTSESPDPTSTVTDAPTSAPTEEPTAEPTAEPTDEPVSNGSKGTEDDTDVYNVDALGNAPGVYDFNYGVGESYIRNVTDYGDYFVVTFDTMYQIWVDVEDLANVKVGDVINVMDKPVTVTDILSIDDDYNYTVPHESVAEAGLDARVIVLPVNMSDFYTAEEIESNDFDANPEYASFGFVYGDDAYYAYNDWAWDDCYVPMLYYEMCGVNFVVTDETKVRPSLYDY
jgi:hypothetical protein